MKTRTYLITLKNSAGNLDARTVTVKDGDDDAEAAIKGAVLEIVHESILSAGDRIFIEDVT